jgi:hypothetical protein
MNRDSRFRYPLFFNLRPQLVPHLSLHASKGKLHLRRIRQQPCLLVIIHGQALDGVAHLLQSLKLVVPSEEPARRDVYRVSVFEYGFGAWLVRLVLGRCRWTLVRTDSATSYVVYGKCLSVVHVGSLDVVVMTCEK